MSRGHLDKYGILTFRPRVVSKIRRKVANGHKMEEYKKKDKLGSVFDAISRPEDKPGTIRMLGNKQGELRESRKVGVNISEMVVIADENKIVGEDKLRKGKLQDNEKEKKIEKERSSKKGTSVTKIKIFSVALSKVDTDFISRCGVNVIKKIEQITGASIERSGHGTMNERAFIRGSEEDVMKAKNIIKLEEIILTQGQVSFLLRDGGKRLRSIEKDSNTLIRIKGNFGDDMRPVTLIGTEPAITIAKLILEEAVIIQAKIKLLSEVHFLLHGDGKLIKRIQIKAKVDVEFKGKRGDKGTIINVIGSKEAVAKAWAMIQNALNKLEE